MKKTGKINPITGDEILQAEVQDIAWEIEWNEMDDIEKCSYLSYKGIGFLGEMNREYVITLFNSERVKGLAEKIRFYSRILDENNM